MSADKHKFKFDERLGISLPFFEGEWESLSNLEQIKIINQWEKERAKIPDRIKELEQKILDMQETMFDMSFEEYCEIHKEIVSLSSTINDLNIWFRTHGEVTNHS